MASSFKKRKSFFHLDNSSDSDSSPSFYKRKTIQRTTAVKASLQMFCDNDSPIEEKSNSSLKFIKEKDNSVVDTNIIDKYANFKSGNKENTCHASVKTIKGKHNEHEAIFRQEYYLDEDSCNSSASLDRSKQKFFKPSNVNKHSSRNNKVEVTGSKQIIDNVVHQNMEETEKNQEALINFKPHIMKMMEEMKYILSKFKLEIHHLQLKYLQDEIVTKQDTKYIMSTYNSIMNKLKEELTEQQQNSMRSYHQWGETEAHSCSSTNSETFSSTCKRPKMTKRATNNFSCWDNKNVTSQSNVKNDTNKQPLETNCTSAVTIGNNNNYDNTTSKSNRGLSPLLSRLKEINIIKKSAKTPVADSRITEHMVPNLEALNQERKKTIGHRDTVKQDSLRNESVREKGLLDYDSDVNSTCSTIALYPSRKINAERTDSYQDDLIDADMDRTRDRHTSKSPPSDVTLIGEEENDGILMTKLYFSDSEDTVIISGNKRTDSTVRNLKNWYKDHIPTKGQTVSTFSNGENISSEQRSEFVVPGVNNLSRKYRSKRVVTSNQAVSVPNSKPTKQNQYNAGVDEKLRMNCQVLIEKFKVTAR